MTSHKEANGHKNPRLFEENLITDQFFRLLLGTGLGALPCLFDN